MGLLGGSWERQNWLVVAAAGAEEAVVVAGVLEAVLVPVEADELPAEDEPLDPEDVPLLAVVAV